MTVKRKYFFAGFGFGLMFPIMAVIFGRIVHGGSLSLSGIIDMHTRNPLMFIIDSAPLFLGLFALLGGINQARALALLDDNRQLLQTLEAEKLTLQALSQKQEDLLQHVAKHTSTLESGFRSTKKDMRHVLTVNDHVQSLQDNIAEVVECLRSHVETSNHKMSETELELEQFSSKVRDSLTKFLAYEHAFTGLESQMLASSEASSHLTVIVETMTHNIQRIHDISAQINTLALNASIEAARAGEHGRGFNVVAEEVRKLSAETSESLHQVTAVQNELKKQALEISQDLHDLTREVNNKKEDAKMLGSTLSLLSVSLDQVEHYMKSLVHQNEAQYKQFQQAMASTKASRKDIDSLSAQIQAFTAQIETQMTSVNALNSLCLSR